MSNNIEKARADLQISGYVHPTTANPSTGKKSYKSFNTESKKEDYMSSKAKSKYATFTDKNSVKQSNGCPDCGGEALYVCECEFNDKQCSKGHVWYINGKGHIKHGDPHENE
jgi:hypothetical protein